jgi:hypothetical protein
MGGLRTAARAIDPDQPTTAETERRRQATKNSLAVRPEEIDAVQTTDLTGWTQVTSER